MNFFCPRCNQTVPCGADTACAQCPQCGLNVDLTRLRTASGGPQLPLVWDRTCERLGPYVLEQVLGSGGMGTVYRAQDTRDGKIVAVKLLFPQFCALPHLVERFQREARALSKLVHPRIVQYITDGEIQGTYYLVMEYVEGESLELYLKNHKPNPERVFEITSQICEALWAAHQAGVVHRDLKPSNIIMSKDGVRILDFGIAQITVEDGTLTHSDAILGTVNYMSPEQRLRSHGVDHRTDLYAVGVILYFMLTGKLPLGAFEPVSRLNSRVPKKTDRIVERTLQYDPERRYQTAQELMEDLSSLRPAPNTRWALMAALFLLVVFGAAGLTLWNRWPKDSAEKLPAPQAGLMAAISKGILSEEASTQEIKEKKDPEKLLTSPNTTEIKTTGSERQEATQILLNDNKPASKDGLTSELGLGNGSDSPGLEQLSTRTTRPSKKAKAPQQKSRVISKEKIKDESSGQSKKSIQPESASGKVLSVQGRTPWYLAIEDKEPAGFLAQGDQITLLDYATDKSKQRWIRVKTEEGKFGFVPMKSLARRANEKKGQQSTSQKLVPKEKILPPDNQEVEGQQAVPQQAPAQQ